MMSEIPQPAQQNAATPPQASKEVRHNPNFRTVVVGARHEGPDATYRKGEVYQNGRLRMARFLRLTESGTSVGMLVVTGDSSGQERRFYVMRGAPKGVIAHPTQQVSITEVEKSIQASEFVTKVFNAEDIAAQSVIVGQEIVQGAGPVVRIILDTGERVPIDQIDTNTNGQPLFTPQLREANAAMKIVEQHAEQPFGR